MYRAVRSTLPLPPRPPFRPERVVRLATPFKCTPPPTRAVVVVVVVEVVVLLVVLVVLVVVLVRVVSDRAAATNPWPRRSGIRLPCRERRLREDGAFQYGKPGDIRKAKPSRRPVTCWNGR